MLCCVSQAVKSQGSSEIDTSTRAISATKVLVPYAALHIGCGLAPLDSVELRNTSGQLADAVSVNFKRKRL